MENILNIKDLRVSFHTEEGWVEVISGVSLSVPKGKTVGVVGESGCGKTVTALSVMRLISQPPGRIDSGEVIFQGRDLLKLPEKEMRKIRGNQISMIFQEPMSSLNPVFPVGDQIGEAIRTHLRVSKKEEKDRVIELLKLVRIPSPETIVKSYPHELSGGMCQRVMIAMALSCNPDLLIADEPTTALDVTIQAGILKLLDELKEKLGMSVLLITHDLGIIAEETQEVYVMYAGKIVEYADVKTLFGKPLHPYTRGLMESIPRGEGKKKRLSSISGIVPQMRDIPSGCRFRDRCPLAIEQCGMAEPEFREIEKGRFAACIRV